MSPKRGATELALWASPDNGESVSRHYIEPGPVSRPADTSRTPGPKRARAAASARPHSVPPIPTFIPDVEAGHRTYTAPMRRPSPMDRPESPRLFPPASFPAKLISVGMIVLAFTQVWESVPQMGRLSFRLSVPVALLRVTTLGYGIIFAVLLFPMSALLGSTRGNLGQLRRARALTISALVVYALANALVAATFNIFYIMVGHFLLAAPAAAVMASVGIGALVQEKGVTPYALAVGYLPVVSVVGLAYWTAHRLMSAGAALLALILFFAPLSWMPDSRETLFANAQHHQVGLRDTAELCFACALLALSLIAVPSQGLFLPRMLDLFGISISFWGTYLAFFILALLAQRRSKLVPTFLLAVGTDLPPQEAIPPPGGATPAGAVIPPPRPRIFRHNAFVFGVVTQGVLGGVLAARLAQLPMQLFLMWSEVPSIWLERVVLALYVLGFVLGQCVLLVRWRNPNHQPLHPARYVLMGTGLALFSSFFLITMPLFSNVWTILLVFLACFGVGVALADIGTIILVQCTEQHLVLVIPAVAGRLLILIITFCLITLPWGISEDKAMQWGEWWYRVEDLVVQRYYPNIMLSDQEVEFSTVFRGSVFVSAVMMSGICVCAIINDDLRASPGKRRYAQVPEMVTCVT